MEGINNNNTDEIDVPTDADVLCGRGKPIQDHPGNRRFLEVVEKYREAYQTARTRADKQRITNQVMSEVHGYGARFLQLDSNTKRYKVVKFTVCRDKVCHALRNRSKVTAANNNDNTATDDSDVLDKECSGIVGEDQIKHHGMLFTNQQQIFRALVDTDDYKEGEDDDDDDDDEFEMDTTTTTAEDPPDDGQVPSTIRIQDSKTFDELLRLQKVIFENLVVDDETTGSGGSEVLHAGLTA